MAPRILLACTVLAARSLALLAPALHQGRPALLQQPRRLAGAVRCAEDADEEKTAPTLLDEVVGAVIPETTNPYLTSKADRMRAAGLGDAVVGQSARSGGRRAAEDRLAEDIARFKAERGLDELREEEEEEAGLLYTVIDTLGTILTYNFGIIITFFAWFLTGVGMQYGAQNTVVIDAFRGCWDVLIMPLLTTHMTLTFLSFGLEKVAKAGSEA